VQTNSEVSINPSNPPTSRAIGYKSRHVAKLSNVPLSGRSAWMSRIQQVAALAPADSDYPRLLAFLQFWKWAPFYIASDTRSAFSKDIFSSNRVYERIIWPRRRIPAIDND